MKHVEMIIEYLTDGTDFQYFDNHGTITDAATASIIWRISQTMKRMSFRFLSVCPLIAQEDIR